MKKLLFLLVVSIFMNSCNNNNYTITGTVADEEANGKVMYLFDLNAQQRVDSTTVVNGTLRGEELKDKVSEIFSN